MKLVTSKPISVDFEVGIGAPRRGPAFSRPAQRFCRPPSQGHASRSRLQGRCRRHQGRRRAAAQRALRLQCPEAGNGDRGFYGPSASDRACRRELRAQSRRLILQNPSSTPQCSLLSAVGLARICVACPKPCHANALRFVGNGLGTEKAMSYTPLPLPAITQ